jgi:hypothetical protein
METQSPTPASFEETYFKSEYCLITNAVYPMRVYQPCTDLLPRTMSWLAAGVPTDFMDRVTANLDRWEDGILIDLVDQAIERANLGEHGMAQVPDPGE